MADKKKSTASSRKKSNGTVKKTAAKTTRKRSTDFDDFNKSRKTGRRQAVKNYKSDDKDSNSFKSYRRNPHDEKARHEITVIITGLVCLLFVLSYLNICGVFGKVINIVLFGLMGRFSYVFPFVLFAAVLYSMKTSEKRLAGHRIMLSSVGCLFIMAFIHTVILFDSVTIAKAFTLGYKEKKGGGFLGALIGVPLGKLFGKVGSILIIIAVLIIILIALTGKAIFHIINQKTRDEYKDLSNRHKENKERREKERLERDAESGRETYDRIMNSDRPKIYKADIAPFNPNTGKKKKNVSFIEKLKNGNADIPVNDNSFFEEPKKEVPAPVDKKEISAKDEAAKINHEMDMIEITGSADDTLFAGEKSVYELEMERKFGGNSQSTSTILTERTDDPEPVITGNFVENNPEPVTSRSFVNTLPEEKPEQKSNSAGVFARGDYRPEGTPEVKSHSLAGLQSDTVPASPAANATGSPMLVKKASKPKPKKPYVFPPISLLEKAPAGAKGTTKAELNETAKKLQDTLKSFGVNVTITNISCGPSVTRYELQPEVGVKVSKITSLTDDIKLNLAAADIRMEAPIPGKSAIGIEVPNKVNQTVFFSSLVESSEFKNSKSRLTFGVGKDIGGQVIVSDIAKMPHLLIAGATGSGKSVCINTLIMSLIYKADPEDVKLILVDPKVVELSVYNGLPHLLIPVVTDPKKASGALNWAVMEMTDRYKKFADLGVRDLAGYNKKVIDAKGELKGSSGEIYEKLPQIVFVIDELADLMMVAPGEVEDYIIRLTQLARACGIHLIIATQRPSVNVITGLIKANVPSRIAFSVASQVDSRTILDMVGAEKLLGKGDMLFYPAGYTKPVRVQGAFISDAEVSRIVDYVKSHNSESDTAEMEEKMMAVASVSSSGSGSSGSSSDDNGLDVDDLIYKAGMFIIEKEKASIGSLQRQFKIGFNRAARIMDQLAEAGVVGPEEGTKPRQILMSAQVFDQYAADNGLPR